MSKKVTVVSQPNLTYQDYYLRPINQQLRTDTFGGLKLVVGPTGLGKTYANAMILTKAEWTEKSLFGFVVLNGHSHWTGRHNLAFERNKGLVMAKSDPQGPKPSP